MIYRAKRAIGVGAVVAMTATAIAGTPATAQAQQSQDSQGAQTSTPDFSENKLEAYADAVVQVSALVAEWRPKIQSAQQEQDKEKVRDLQKQANAELMKAVQDAEGITLDEYKRISQAVRQDKELYNRLQGMVQERREGK